MNKMMNRSISVKLTGLALMTLGAAGASAQAPLSNSVFAGAYFLKFHSTTQDLAGPYTVPGLNADLKDTTTLYLAYIRRLSPHFDLELAAGWPPNTKTVGVGPANVGSVPFNGQTLITAKWISPTLLLDYKFFDEETKFRPYLGVGINHTAFYDRQVTAEGQAITGGPTKLSLQSSTGIAATAGLSYQFAPRWYAHASYSISNIHTDAIANTAGIIRTTHIDFGPRALVVAVGYTF